jgi:Domain of unknown function (DUF4112)
MFAKFLAELLDQRFTIPGTSIRIGLDPIIGLIPGIGDTLANLAGSAILVIAAQLRLPKIVLLRMGWNIAVNTLIGAIPLVGDIFSIWFRSNVKNVQLLERYAPQRGTGRLGVCYCSRDRAPTAARGNFGPDGLGTTADNSFILAATAVLALCHL